MLSHRSSSSISRRSWLRLSTGTLAAVSLSSRTSAEEATGRWDEKGIVEYSQKMIDWLKANFAARASSIADHTGAEFPLAYDYLAPTTDKIKLRNLARFAEAKLSDKAVEEHLTKSLTELEKIRQSLAAAEAKAFQTWKPSNTEETAKEGKIYESSVSASRLTVILDNSRSMEPHLAAVRKEITRDFASAYFVEVDGCQMEYEAAFPWFFAGPTKLTNPFSPDRFIPSVPTVEDIPHSCFARWTRSTPSALHCMLNLMKSDAIYWFCDFDDHSREEVITEFGKTLLERKTKLFIHTLDKKPPSKLVELAERSGGKVIKKRV